MIVDCCDKRPRRAGSVLPVPGSAFVSLPLSAFGFAVASPAPGYRIPPPRLRNVDLETPGFKKWGPRICAGLSHPPRVRDGRAPKRMAIPPGPRQTLGKWHATPVKRPAAPKVPAGATRLPANACQTPRKCHDRATQGGFRLREIRWEPIPSHWKCCGYFKKAAAGPAESRANPRKRMAGGGAATRSPRQTLGGMLSRQTKAGRGTAECGAGVRNAKRRGIPGWRRGSMWYISCWPDGWEVSAKPGRAA